MQNLWEKKTTLRGRYLANFWVSLTAQGTLIKLDFDGSTHVVVHAVDLDITDFVVSSKISVIARVSVIARFDCILLLC